VAPNKKVVRAGIEKAITETYAAGNNVFALKDIDKLIEKATGSAVDSIVQYTAYEPVAEAEINITNVENKIYTEVSNSLKNTTLPADKKAAKETVIKVAKRKAYEVIESERLNLRYNYFYDMLIFFGLSLSSLIFAFLLKLEDKRKGYGLELPNIQK
jgi:preprotein translocase subunit SecA